MNVLLRGLEHPLAESVGWALLHFLWQGLAVVTLLTLSLLVLRRRSAQARYVVCCAALAAMGMLPVATTIWCRATASPSTSTYRLPAATNSADSQIRPGPLPGDSGDDSDQPLTAGIAAGNQPGTIPDDVAAAALLPTAAASPTWHDRVRTAIPWCVAAWLCGVLILSVRLLAIWSRVQRLRRVGVAPVSSDILAMFTTIVARLRISRPVKLLQSTLVEVPTVIGWLRPVILLPIASLAGLTPLQLEAILIHELAHIRRWDYLVNLLQNVAETLLFYHPAVWWVSARIRQERENCCDDLAAAMCGDRVGYAEALVRMEELRAPWGHVAVAARGGNLLDRVRRLLSANERDRLPPWWQSPVAALVVVAGLIAGFWSVTRVTVDSQAIAGSEQSDESSNKTESTDAADAADAQATAGPERGDESSNKVEPDDAVDVADEAGPQSKFILIWRCVVESEFVERLAADWKPADGFSAKDAQLQATVTDAARLRKALFEHRRGDAFAVLSEHLRWHSVPERPFPNPQHLGDIISSTEIVNLPFPGNRHVINFSHSFSAFCDLRRAGDSDTDALRFRGKSSYYSAQFNGLTADAKPLNSNFETEFEWDLLLQRRDALVLRDPIEPILPRKLQVLTVMERVDVPRLKSDLYTRQNSTEAWLAGGPPEFIRKARRAAKWLADAPNRIDPPTAKFTRRLSNGAVVRLVALSRPVQHPFIWWTPAGRPVDFTGSGYSATRRSTEGDLAALVQIVHDAPADQESEPITLGNRSKGRSHTSNGVVCFWRTDAGKTVTQFVILRAKVAPDGGNPFVEIGAGSGAWTTLGNVQSKERFRSDDGAVETSDVQAFPGLPRGEYHTVSAAFSRLPIDHEVSLVAVAKDGRKAEGQNTPRGHNRESNQTFAAYSDYLAMSIDDLDHYEIRIRPLQWARFDEFLPLPDELATANQEGAQAPRPQNVIPETVRGAEGRPVDKADVGLVNKSPTVSAEASGGPPGQQTLADLVLEREPGQANDIHPATARLFIASSEGTEMKPLNILPEYVYHGSPRWSPDGKRIVFNVWKHGENHTSGQIAVANSDGTSPRILIDGLLPSFSPQGDRIAFSRLGPNSGVWVMASEGPDTDLQRIDANGWGTDWSPDGKLVYSTATASGANLVVFDRIDASRRLLFDEQKSPYKNLFWNMAWSPDGRRIVFKGLTTNDKYEVGLVDARGAKQGLVHRIDGEVLATFAWSPDGSRVLLCKSCPEREHRSQIYSFDPDTNDPPQLLAGQDPTRHCVDVAWSPDGKQIAVSCFMQPAKKVQAVRASISPELLKARFVANFRGKRTDPSALRLIRGSDERYVALTDEGLKMDLPAGEKKPEQAGISTEFLIRGDFELTAVFRSLKVHQPAAGWGAGLDLLLQLGTGPKDFILVERKLSGAGESVFATKHGHVDSAGKYQWQISHHPPNEVDAGKIRVVRKGNVVYYLFAEYGTDDYQLFDEKVISAEDVRLLKFVACANDREAGSELLLEELEILAAELPGLVKGQP